MPPKRNASQKNGSAGDSSQKKKAKNAIPDSILPDNWFENNKSRMFVGAHVGISGNVFADHCSNSRLT